MPDTSVRFRESKQESVTRPSNLDSLKDPLGAGVEDPLSSTSMSQDSVCDTGACSIDSAPPVQADSVCSTGACGV